MPTRRRDHHNVRIGQIMCSETTTTTTTRQTAAPSKIDIAQRFLPKLSGANFVVAAPIGGSSGDGGNNGGDGFGHSGGGSGEHSGSSTGGGSSHDESHSREHNNHGGSAIAGAIVGSAVAGGLSAVGGKGARERTDGSHGIDELTSHSGGRTGLTRGNSRGGDLAGRIAGAAVAGGVAGGLSSHTGRLTNSASGERFTGIAKGVHGLLRGGSGSGSGALGSLGSIAGSFGGNKGSSSSEKLENLRGGGFAGGFPGKCFAAEATVLLESGRKVTMKELRVGDKIQTDIGVYETVERFLHRKHDQPAAFLRIATDHSSLLVTDRHLLPIVDCDFDIDKVHMADVMRRLAVFAHRAQVGHCVLTQHGVERIHNISTTISMGIYSPWVRSGMLFVDGVHVSAYSSVESHQLAHSFFLVADRLLQWFTAWPMNEDAPLLLRAAHALTDLILSQ